MPDRRASELGVVPLPRGQRLRLTLETLDGSRYIVVTPIVDDHPGDPLYVDKTAATVLASRFKALFD